MERRQGGGGVCVCVGGEVQANNASHCSQPITPSPGSQRRRHASATSSPPVTSRIKAGDFSSALARMLFFAQTMGRSFGQACFGLALQ